MSGLDVLQWLPGLLCLCDYLHTQAITTLSLPFILFLDIIIILVLCPTRHMYPCQSNRSLNTKKSEYVNTRDNFRLTVKGNIVKCCWYGHWNVSVTSCQVNYLQMSKTERVWALFAPFHLLDTLPLPISLISMCGRCIILLMLEEWGSTYQ